MPLVISTKTVVKAGAVCTAIAAILGIGGTTLAFLGPLSASGPMPFPSRAEVLAEDHKIVELAQNFQQMQRHQDYDDYNALLFSRSFLISQITQEQNELRVHPYNTSARAQLNNDESQLNTIQRLLASRHP